MDTDDDLRRIHEEAVARVKRRKGEYVPPPPPALELSPGVRTLEEKIVEVQTMFPQLKRTYRDPPPVSDDLKHAVVCVDTGKLYPDAGRAAREYGRSKEKLLNAIHCGALFVGKRWRFATDEDRP